MSVPAGSSRSPVEEALDRMEERAAGSGISDEDVATVRSALERLTEERDAARRTRFQADNMVVVPEDRALRAETEADKYRKATDQQARRAEAAEAEVRRLNGYIDQYILDVERLTEERDAARREIEAADSIYLRRADAAESEVVRLTEERDAAIQALEGPDRFGRMWKRAESAEAEVSRLTAELQHTREGLRDFAEHGTRFDCNPTVMVHSDNEEWMRLHSWWVSRANDMDAAVRRRARDLLTASPGSGDPSDGGGAK